jgi:hypothetical protein
MRLLVQRIRTHRPKCVDLTLEHPLRSEAAITSRAVIIRSALCRKGSIVSYHRTLTYYIGISQFSSDP